MENYCNGCTSSHQELMNTWDKKSSLHPSNYDPFKGVGYTKENFCCNNYNCSCSASAWTRPGNITPENSPGYNTAIITNKRHKENFCCDSHNTYASLNHTWTKQKSYSSN